MKSSKTHDDKLLLVCILACLMGAASSMPETLLEAVHANQVSHNQKKLMKQMMKLHNSLKKLDPLSLANTKHTSKKNEYLKKFRGQRKATKK